MDKVEALVYAKLKKTKDKREVSTITFNLTDFSIEVTFKNGDGEIFPLTI